MIKHRSQSGLTFIEIIIAVMMLALVSSAFATLYSLSYRSVFDSGWRLAASIDAQGVIDRVLYAGTSGELELSEIRGVLDVESAAGRVDRFNIDEWPTPPFDAHRVTVWVIRNGREAELSVLIPVRVVIEP